MKQFALGLLGVVLLHSGTLCLRGAALFFDDFSTNSASNWNELQGSSDGVSRSQAIFAYDYSADGIPAAPRSRDGSTLGLKLSANGGTAVAARSAVNVFPAQLVLPDNFVVDFDLFIHFGGAIGTTQYGLFGVHQKGTLLNAQLTADVLSGSQDGIWWALSGDGGADAAASDYRAYDGTQRLADADSGYQIPTDVTMGLPEGSFLGKLFPQPKWPKPGAPGNRWVRVRIQQYGRMVTMTFNDNLVLSRTLVPGENHSGGTLMLGCMEPLLGALSDQPSQLFCVVDNLTVGRIVTVDSIDNGSGPADGKTSLLEALNDLRDGDEVRFNLPGTGVHYIATPAAGYPLVTAHRVTLDGYSQPGSLPNRQPILSANGAAIRVVLDSRGRGRKVISQDPLLTSTFDEPGYGDSESAILALLGAQDVRIRGLGFLATGTAGTAEDPSIYAIALVRDANFNQICGCWFGVDADGSTVAAGDQAVTSFQYQQRDENLTTLQTITTQGVAIGTRGDGPDGVGDFNVFAGWRVPVVLEGNSYKVSGNFFNVLPDGITDYNMALVGLPEEAPLQIGRGGANTVIGTDGDGQSDELERNVFGGIVPLGAFGPGTGYPDSIEFYGESPTRLIVAGNYFGLGVDGQIQFTNSSPAIGGLGAGSTVQFGSNSDGLSDDLEGNWLVNNRPFSFFFPTPDPTQIASVAGLFNSPDPSASISWLGNHLENNGAIPVPLNQVTNGYYSGVLVDPSQPVPTITQLSVTELAVSFPPATASYPMAQVDVYLADRDGLSLGSGFAIGGFPQGQNWLATVWDGGTNDLDPQPNAIRLNLEPLGLSGGDPITVAVTYGTTNPPLPGERVTGPFAPALLLPDTGPLGVGTPKLGVDGFHLLWTNGIPPFLVQFKGTNSTTWFDLATTSSRTLRVPAVPSTTLFRVIEQATNHVLLFKTTLTPDQVIPAGVVSSIATGEGWLSLNLDSLTAAYYLGFSGLAGDLTHVQLRGPSRPGANGGLLFPLQPANFPPGFRERTLLGSQAVSPEQIDAILSGKSYFNVATFRYTGGELRGQLTR